MFDGLKDIVWMFLRKERTALDHFPGADKE